jgi:uncharacterized Zn-finger protein
MDPRPSFVLLHKKYKNTTVCPYCNKNFNSTRYLLTHINLHLQEYIYRCSFCKYETYSFDTLRGHIRTKHSK